MEEMLNCIDKVSIKELRRWSGVYLGRLDSTSIDRYMAITRNDEVKAILCPAEWDSIKSLPEELFGEDGEQVRQTIDTTPEQFMRIYDLGELLQVIGISLITTGQFQDTVGRYSDNASQYSITEPQAYTGVTSSGKLRGLITPPLIGQKIIENFHNV